MHGDNPVDKDWNKFEGKFAFHWINIHEMSNMMNFDLTLKKSSHCYHLAEKYSFLIEAYH